MKILFSWLKELVDLSWTVDETADKLAELGFPVERVERTGVRARNVIAARILAVDKHPNADRLRIAKVNDGTADRTIVCGAPNIAPGQVVPLAVPGAKLPDGTEIALSKIRGVESQGMLCSERELGLSDEHAGILQLAADAPLGSDIRSILGGEDAVLDIEITPNRPDLLSHVGIARELAAASGAALKLPALSAPAAGGRTVPIAIDAADRCSRYFGRVLTGVHVAASPDWVARRLKACGMRPINNVVDITNLVLLEFGHPLHAFDLATLEGPEIHVRTARAGESLAALDERTYPLSEADLVIADRTRAVAIAGIMGGAPTGVTEKTRDILLESAVFERGGIRRTSRRLALRSESSFRFEKGTNALTAEQASRRAIQLLIDLADAAPQKTNDVGAAAGKSLSIPLRRTRLAQIMGLSVRDADVASGLQRLGIGVTAVGDGWSCAIPPFRADLQEEADLIEEVARLVGYNAVPSTPPAAKPATAPAAFRVKPLRPLGERLKGAGFSETITTSLCGASTVERFGVKAADLVFLENPLSQDESALRPLLLPNLVDAVVRNANRQRDRIALYEIGNIVVRGKERPAETARVALVWAGLAREKTWAEADRTVDVFDLKGVLDGASVLVAGGLTMVPGGAPAFLHPYQSFTIQWRGRKIGFGGALHPGLAKEVGLDLKCVVAEMDVEPFAVAPAESAAPLPKFAFVERDIAVVVPVETPWATLEEAVRKAGGDALLAVWPFDRFSGGSLPAGRQSLAFRVRLRHADRMLSDAEITDIVQRVKDALQSRCGAQLR